ncbi:CRISPR system precrRNA processing endoribonuclease RAMP protein Cas6 [Treponema primitia]|nr:CRISPR system precrRNA processing endoribonuclease RAMP protein Cas6 [Treponema primitia]
MKLFYKKIRFTLAFAGELRFPVPPAFVFRSIIGAQLHRICCIAHGVKCPDCMFSGTCAYGFAFESILPRDNPVLSGRDRISHPVIIETESFLEKPGDSLGLYLIFLGPAIKYLPYFFYALKKGGEAGILRERVPFRVTGVFDDGHELLEDEETLNTRFEPDVWEYVPGDGAVKQRRLMVQMLSPLRFKVQGHYDDSFSAADFALCLHRRTRTLCSQYGVVHDNDVEGGYYFSEAWAIKERNLVWRDFAHYSARQRKTMQFGGLTGSMVLEGAFSAYEYACLGFAEIFHAGKNTNFGLGRVTVWAKEG